MDRNSEHRLTEMGWRVREFFSKRFSRLVPDDMRWAYRTSAVLADLVLFGSLRHSGPTRIDAVVFPAVKAGYGMNVAMRPDVFNELSILERVEEWICRTPVPSCDSGRTQTIQGWVTLSARGYRIDEEGGRIEWGFQNPEERVAGLADDVRLEAANRGKGREETEELGEGCEGETTE